MVFVRSEATKSTLVYAGDLPIRWMPFDEGIDHFQESFMNSSNSDTLRAILALEHTAKEKVDAEHGTAHELQRIEHKVDLLMSLTAQLLAKDLSLPRELPCKLSAHELEWSDEHAPEVGHRVILHVYLSHKFPRAVIFPVVVREVVSSPPLLSIKADFIDLPETVRDLLERLIFQRHRRQVARAQKG